MTMETTETNKDWNDVAAASADKEAAAAQASMPPRRFEERLPCKLTDDELREKGSELEAALGAVDVLEEEKAETGKAFKARIELAEARVRELRTCIRTKNEDRDIECLEIFELRLGVARTVRVDDGTLIRERALRSSELQTSLSLGPNDANDEDDDDQLSLDDAADEDADLREPDIDDDETVIRDPEIVLGAEAQAPERRVIRRRKKGEQLLKGDV